MEEQKAKVNEAENVTEPEPAVEENDVNEDQQSEGYIRKTHAVPPEVEVKKCIGIKIVMLWPEKESTFRKQIQQPLAENEEDRHGYGVVYENGYRSWSPKRQADDAYRPTDNLNFGLAIEAAKKGLKIARRGWNGKNMFVVYMPPLHLPPFNTQGTNRKVNDRTAKYIGEDKPLDCQPYFAMYNAQEQWIPGWLASQSDMLADDWFIVDCLS